MLKILTRKKFNEMKKQLDDYAKNDVVKEKTIFDLRKEVEALTKKIATMADDKANKQAFKIRKWINGFPGEHYEEKKE